MRPLESIYNNIRNIYSNNSLSLIIENTNESNIEQLKLDIVEGKMKLYNIAPYLGRLISEVNIIIVDPNDSNVKTMGVDNHNNLYINPTWSTTLSKDEFLGVFAHEMLHIANGTHIRQGARKLSTGSGITLWNLATDAVMNYALSQSGFKIPEGGIIPDSSGEYQFKNEDGKLLGTIYVTENRSPLPAENVYNQIVEIFKNLKSDDQKSIAGKDGTTDKHLNDGEASESSKGKAQKISPEELDAVEQDRQHKISDVDKGEQTTTNKGSSIRELVQKSIPIKINWRGVITKYLKLLDKKSYNWMIPKKRAFASGYYAPSYKSDPSKLSAIFAIDTSGSISPEMLKTFFDAIDGMISAAKKINIYIVLWHDKVYDNIGPIKNSNMLWDAYNKRKLQGGGTKISSCNEYIKDLNSELTIFLTDGEVDDSDLSSLTKISKKLFIILNPQLDNDIAKKFKSIGETLIINPNNFK